MLKPDQAQQLKEGRLDHYNHNLDTSPEYYGEIITTRTYQDRPIPLALYATLGSRCVAVESWEWAKP